ncbi:MAG: hypothetical protein K6A37_07015 [Saccharofermentans sp.]|nr:hypothetical protein [Saccharofermentans sp.]
MRMRKITSILLTGAVCLSLAGCSVKSPRKLFRYAQRTYGDCELIDTEESDDYTRIVVRDNLQGFEYEVVSGMYELSIDGSSFGSVEDTRSSFDLALKEYVFGEVQDELEDICEDAGVEGSQDSFCLWLIRCDDEQAGIDAALECAGILQEYNLDNRMDDWEIVVQAYQAYNEYGDKRYGSVVLPDIEWVSHEQETADYFLDTARMIADTDDVELTGVEVKTFADTGLALERVAQTTYQVYPTSDDSPVTFYYFETGDGKQFYVCDFLYYYNDYYESEWYNTFEGTR